MHQKPLGLSAPPDPIAAVKGMGPLQEEGEMGRKGRRGEGMGREEKRGEREGDAKGSTI